MRTTLAARVLLTSIAAVTGAAHAQSLLKNIHTSPPAQPAKSDPEMLVSARGFAYFTAGDQYRGRELWRSDGTSGGTSLVADLNPGPADAFPQFGGYGAATVDAVGTLYFVALSPSGTRLYVSDGTATGTVALTPPSVWAIPTPNSMLAVGTDVYFWAGDTTYGNELWKTNGTLPGTARVADINPNGGAWNSLSRMSMAAVGGIVYFPADNGANGTELWRTDGTAAGTWLVADVNPGSPESDPHGLTELGGALLFAAKTTVAGPYYWWRVNASGTAATRLTTVVEPRVDSSGGLRRAGVLYFAGWDPANGTELWRTDGSPAGTSMVKDINPSGNASPSDLVEFAGEIFFSASDGTTGTELWKTDGSANGTQQVADIEPGSRGSQPSGLSAWNGQLYFAAATLALGGELFVTDGTAAGTRVVRELQPGGGTASVLDGPLAAQQGVVFAGDDGVNGREPWATDGTSGGTLLLANIATAPQGSHPAFLMTDGDRAYFRADDGVTGEELWVSDGTANGTRQVADIVPGPGGSFVADMVEWGSVPHFSVDLGSDPKSGIWRTDGTPQGTRQVASAPFAREMEPVDDVLYFHAFDQALWATDGTQTGTRQVRGFSSFGSHFPVGPHKMTNVQGTLFFAASEGKLTPGTSGVWKSDGTSGGTTLVVDIPFTGRNPVTIDLEKTSTGAVFAAAHETLWHTDGTTTTELLRWTYGGNVPTALTIVGDTAYFVAHESGRGYELWKSDGTPSGTVRVADIQPGPGSSFPAGLVEAGGLLWFAADDGRRGVELWKSDGTAAGTLIAADAWLGLNSSSPEQIAPAGSGARVLFTANNLATGREPWVSDGTSAGTLRLADIFPGPGTANITQFTRAGTTVFFNADDGTTGVELWSMPLATTAGNLVEAYGTACSGTGGLAPKIGANGLPTLGNPAFSVELSSAFGSSAAALLLSTAPASIPLGGGCELRVGTPIVAVPVITDPSGRASLPAGAGTRPSLLGVELRFQFAVADPAGAFLGFATFSPGLHVMYGH